MGLGHSDARGVVVIAAGFPSWRLCRPTSAGHRWTIAAIDEGD